MAVPSDWAEIRDVGASVLGPHGAQFEKTEDYDPFVDDDDLNLFHRELLIDTSSDRPLDTAGERGSRAMQDASAFFHLDRQYDGRMSPENQGELFIEEAYGEQRGDIHMAAGAYSREMAGAARRKLTQDSTAIGPGEATATATDFRSRRDTTAGYAERLFRDAIGQRENRNARSQPRQLRGAGATYAAPLTAAIGAGLADEGTFQHGGLRRGTGDHSARTTRSDQDHGTAAEARVGGGPAAPGMATSQTALRYIAATQDWGDESMRRNTSMAAALRRMARAADLTSDVAPDELGETMAALAQSGLRPAGDVAGAWARTAATGDFGQADVTRDSGGAGAGRLELERAGAAAGTVSRSGQLGGDIDTAVHLETAAEMMLAARSGTFVPAGRQRTRMAGMGSHAAATDAFGQTRASANGAGYIAPSAAAVAAVRERTRLDGKLMLRSDAVANYARLAPVAPVSGMSMQDESNLARTDGTRHTKHGAKGLMPSARLHRARGQAHETQAAPLHVNAAARAGGGVRASHASARARGFDMAARALRDGDGALHEPLSVHSSWAAL